MSTSLGLATDGLLDWGGLPTLHIAVRGLLREIDIGDIVAPDDRDALPTRDPLGGRAQLTDREAVLVSRTLSTRSDLSGRGTLGGRAQPVGERLSASYRALNTRDDLPPREDLEDQRL